MEEIRNRCNVPAISVGSIHEGKLVVDDHVGFRQLANVKYASADSPDTHTVYSMNSLSKCFVTAAFCLLVDEGKIRWQSRINEVLPQFSPKDDPSLGEATFVEVLRHSSGIDNPVVTWLGPHGRCLVGRDSFIDLLNDTPTQRDGATQRGRYCYSNVAYGLVVLAIEEISRMSFADFVQARILRPLNMLHTVVTISQLEGLNDAGHLAHSYAKMNDETWKPLEHNWTDETNGPVLGMLGMRSSVQDMLVFYSALMEAYVSTASDRSQRDMGASEWSRAPFETLEGVNSNPLKGAQAMLDGEYWRQPCVCDGGEEHDYYHLFPLVRADMPCEKLSWSSHNLQIPNHNTHSSATTTKLSYHFNGIGLCGTAAVKFFPETRSVVVAFASGLNVGDAAEFAALFATQNMFGLKPERHILGMVDAEIQERLMGFDRVMRDVAQHRNLLLPPMSLAEYVGEYNGFGVVLRVALAYDGTSLELRFGRRDEAVFKLEPYGEDSFSYWPGSRDEWLAGGWLDWDHWEVGLIRFQRSTDVCRMILGATWEWEKNSGPAFFEKTRMDTSLCQPTTEQTALLQPEKEVVRGFCSCDIM